MPCEVEPINEGPRFERLLCYLCGEMEGTRAFKMALNHNVELASWWTAHKEKDALRLQRESDDQRIARAKKSALAKLTAEEKTLLGFNRE
jgi:hypothetical protein